MTSKYSNIFESEYKIDNHKIIFNIKSEETIYTEKCYENLLIIDILISSESGKYEYNNYYAKIDNIEQLITCNIVKKIYDDLYNITFFHNRFIGEITKEKGKIIIKNNSYIEEQLKKLNSITNIYNKYIEYTKDDDFKLKYEAFFEVYFSTHSIPDSIRKEYVKKKSKLFNVLDIDVEIKKKFKGKAQAFAFRMEELENDYKLCKETVIDNSNFENRIKICKYIQDRINNIEKKQMAYNKIKEEKEAIAREKSLNIISKLKKRTILNKKIIYIESRYSYETELENLKLTIKEKTKDDIINDYNMSLDKIKILVNKYIKKLNSTSLKIRKNKQKEQDLKKHIDLMYFDDIYFEMEDIDERLS